MSILQIENLIARYDQIEALHGISFEADQGEIVALIGANGAGKSTTLMSVSGLMKQTCGKIYFEGREIQSAGAPKIAQMGIVQVPEGRRCFCSMTVEENLMMGYYTHRKEKKERQSLERVFGLFPRLKERIHQVADTLSGGEQQMLAIGRAMMAEPKILLMDEPSLGLAPVVVEQVFETILRIREQGVTIVLVEQNARMALSLADKAYVLEVGNIVLQGTGRELLNHESVKAAYLGGL
ncbi:ABC transporter ATP-binding protein [Cuneatibacter sp. NSJ-177]|uniref:ABC transporter ATP-binding protein n=1 Tax=Cuneatibacter sp. NSJ-177 TaxID=2931401 RepID=UPI001FD4B8A8|nr:ABC transporter ATP-binding protein [Cuneatibacter sp. NSJ-177]MCJ7834616.1 ABC transporter ATP-binding protein [Cuneatibacter sp. NSJ-177]